MARIKELENEFDLASYKLLYKDVDSITGIYSQTHLQKHRIILIVKLINGTRRTCSYPRAFYETKIGRKLDFPNETVDHINSNPMDNRFDNLQILSLRDNAKKAHAEGISYRPPKGTKFQCDVNGSNNGMSKLTEDQVLKYRRQFTAGRPKREIVLELGLNRRTIENFLFGVCYSNVPEICERRRDNYTPRK